MKGRKIIILVILLAFVWLCFLLYPITQGTFFFAFDQSRDLLWVKDQVDTLSPSLVGPWGSLEGVFFGPLWFWLLIIPYVLGSGNPIVTTIFNGVILYITAFVGLWVFWKHNRILAISVFLLMLFSPGLRLLSSYAFSQHLLPLLTFFLIYCYIGLLQGKHLRYLYCSLFILSLVFHAEPPTAVASLLSLPVILVFSPLRKLLLSPRVITLAFFSFLLPFTSLILFDLRHDFIQTKAIISYIQGRNDTLGPSVPFFARIADRITKFFDTFRLTLFYHQMIVVYTLLLPLVYIRAVWNKDIYIRNVLRASSIYLLTFFISFTLYTQELKGFYLDGLFSVFIVIASCCIALFWKRSFIAKLVIVSFILFLFVQQIFYTVSLLSGVEKKKAHQSGSLFTNQQQVINWIYTKANNKGFYAYTYSAALFDYPYQYLFMWRGGNKYQYLPAEFSYLPNKPEYVLHKSNYLSKNKNRIKTPAIYLFLIMEKEEREELVNAWLSNFSDSAYPIRDTKLFPDGTRVEMREITK